MRRKSKHLSMAFFLAGALAGLVASTLYRQFSLWMIAVVVFCLLLIFYLRIQYYMRPVHTKKKVRKG